MVRVRQMSSCGDDVFSLFSELIVNKVSSLWDAYWTMQVWFMHFLHSCFLSLDKCLKTYPKLFEEKNILTNKFEIYLYLYTCLSIHLFRYRCIYYNHMLQQIWSLAEMDSFIKNITYQDWYKMKYKIRIIIFLLKKSVIKCPSKETPGPFVLWENSIEYIRKKNINLMQIFPKDRKQKNLFYDISIFLILRLDKNITRKKISSQYHSRT